MNIEEIKSCFKAEREKALKKIFTEMDKEYDATTTMEEEVQRTLSDYLRLSYMNYKKENEL